eukprot:scaffold36275_cov154-Isochrysis_galbana.AAC.5
MSVSGRSGTSSFSARRAPNSTAAAESSPASMSGWSGEISWPSTSTMSACASSSEMGLTIGPDICCCVCMSDGFGWKEPTIWRSVG